jgi:hypothetical protein
MYSCLDCKTVSEFVSWYGTSHTWTFLLKVCEGSVESGGIAATPTLKDFRNEVALVHVVRWLHLICTSLDCYMWLFGEGQVRPSLLLGNEAVDSMSKARYSTLTAPKCLHIQSGQCCTKKSGQSALCATEIKCLKFCKSQIQEMIKICQYSNNQ